MRPRRALRRLILEPALLVSLVDRSTPAQLVLDRTPWWVLCQFAQSHSVLCAALLRNPSCRRRCLPWAKRPDESDKVRNLLFRCFLAIHSKNQATTNHDERARLVSFLTIPM